MLVRMPVPSHREGREFPDTSGSGPHEAALNQFQSRFFIPCHVYVKLMPYTFVINHGKSHVARAIGQDAFERKGYPVTIIFHILHSPFATT